MEKTEGTKVMENEVYKAAMKGDLTILDNGRVSGDERTVTKANILHIAVHHEQYNFIETALRKFPHLVCQGNSDDNTPFHIAAKRGNTRILELLVDCCNSAKLEEIKIPSFPWRVKNSKGNTPLHVALICANFQFAEKLVMNDPELTTFVNNSGETPLHLAVRYRFIDADGEPVLDAMQLMMTNNLGGIFPVQHPPIVDSWDIIRLLLEKNPYVACLRDSNGLTPLLRAALFKTPDWSAIESMLEYSPQSIEVCDSSGKTFFHLLVEHLHHDNSGYLLSINESIHDLKDHQDSDGNTPAHLAVKKGNISMVRFLFQLSANFAIKNEEGVSAADLLRQQSDEFQPLLIKKQALKTVMRCIEIDEEKQKLKNLLSKLGAGETLWMWAGLTFWTNLGNVLHKLIWSLKWGGIVRGLEETEGALEDNDVQEFMKQALDSHPALICETDNDGRTPLHLIASRFPKFIDESVLSMFKCYFDRFEAEYGVEGLCLPPWRMKDKEGNTPLHTALVYGAPLRCFRDFLKFDLELATYQNNEMETPLHLLSRVDLSPNSFEEVKDLRSWSFDMHGGDRYGVSKATCLYNKEGLTPLLKAARVANIPAVKLLCLLEPRDVDKKTENEKKTFWHLLANQTPSDSTDDTEADLEMLLEMRGDEKALKCLAEADSDGNTPLHIAIEKKNFQFARFVMEITPKDALENIMHKRNNKDLSPTDLIGSAEDISPQFDNFIWSKHPLIKILLGARSLYGVPTAMVKDYTNTVGVIAALLATITFTAAFTTPGGLNTNDGTPFLMRKAAFQVFMVSDILAMCLSMVILFCLLWTMGNHKERVVILDLAIFLLQLSFYATLVAFMTGLYATTFPTASWVAIFACTLCSLLILLMRKRVVISAIMRVMKIAFVSRKVGSSIEEFLYLLLCSVPKREMVRRSRLPNEICKLKLKLHKHELVKTWRDGYFCEVCRSLGSNWSFCCQKCSFYLHPECALKKHEKNDMLSWIPKRIMTCCSQQPEETTNEVAGSSATHDDAHSEQPVQPRPMWRIGKTEKLKLELHEHELELAQISPFGEYTCGACNKPGGKWSFWCEECYFHLHTKCAFQNNDKAKGECSKVKATEEDGKAKARDDEGEAGAKEGNTCEGEVSNVSRCCE